METNRPKRIELNIHDLSKIESLQLSIENKEYKNNSIFGDCRTELFNFGWIYAVSLYEEFNENTDFEIKFDTDFNFELESQPNIKQSYFKENEIERINGIKDLIVKCFGNSKVYRTYNQFVSMCNYLDFLQDYQPAPSNTDNTKPTKQPKPPLIFSELFVKEFQSKLNVMFERLRLRGIIDDNNNWIINGKTLNEPAKLFYYLKDNNVLQYKKFAPAIKCFYSKFGCEVVEEDNGNPRACTRVNLLINCDDKTEKRYNSFLLSLINQR